MRGISRISILEIFSNPTDLEFTIGEDGKIHKFGFGVFRGPGHNYKPVITTEAVWVNFDAVVAAIQELLESIQKDATEMLNDPSSLAAKILKPDGAEIDPSKVLNEDVVKWILAELRAKKSASTCKMLQPQES